LHPSECKGMAQSVFSIIYARTSQLHPDIKCRWCGGTERVSCWGISSRGARRCAQRKISCGPKIGRYSTVWLVEDNRYIFTSKRTLIEGQESIWPSKFYRATQPKAKNEATSLIFLSARQLLTQAAYRPSVGQLHPQRTERRTFVLGNGIARRESGDYAASITRFSIPCCICKKCCTTNSARFGLLTYIMRHHS